MNCAMQDGFNLGWRLALVAKGLMPKDSLAEYENERRPIAKQVLKGTDLLHSIIMAHGKGIAERIAQTAEELFSERLVKIISGNGFSYASSDGEEASSADSFGNVDLRVRPGDHAPDVLVSLWQEPSKCCRLSHVPGLYYTVVALGEVADETCKEIESLFGGSLVSVVRCTAPTVDEPVDALDKLLPGQYGEHSFALVRPDKYIQSLHSSGDSIVQDVRKSLLTSGLTG